MTTPFPGTPDFTGFNEPVRMECDVFDLVVEGEIPGEIKGTWYRSTPDPQYPPMYPNDTFISGDGMISSFRFANGHVDFRMRYVMTERLLDDRNARKSLHGRYRNPYTDDPAVHGHNRGAANTTPFLHAGQLFALKEDSHAVALNTESLETIGEWDFDGQLRSQTMTAHPKLDPDTGELYFFGYEASGLATTDVAFCVANADGRLVREEWFTAPYCALMHDFVVTKEHVVFPFFPITADLERIKSGGPHWIWEPDKESLIGIMPRDGTVNDLRWFRRPACSVFHFANAFTDGNRVVVDACVADVNPFPFIASDSGYPYNPEDLNGSLSRWTFDLSRPGDQFDEVSLGPPGDLPRIAEHVAMKNHDTVYYLSINPSLGPPQLHGPVYAGFNCLLRLQVDTGRLTQFQLDGTWTLNEPVHIPSAQEGHEGFLALVADNHATLLSEVLLLEAEFVDRGPIARIKLPMRLRAQVHGNWRDESH